MDYLAIGADYLPCMALSFNCIFEVIEQIVPKLCLISVWEVGVVCCRLHSSSLSLLSYLSHLLLHKIPHALYCMGLI